MIGVYPLGSLWNLMPAYIFYTRCDLAYVVSEIKGIKGTNSQNDNFFYFQVGLYEVDFFFKFLWKIPVWSIETDLL